MIRQRSLHVASLGLLGAFTWAISPVANAADIRQTAQHYECQGKAYSGAVRDYTVKVAIQGDRGEAVIEGNTEHAAAKSRIPGLSRRAVALKGSETNTAQRSVFKSERGPEVTFKMMSGNADVSIPSVKMTARCKARPVDGFGTLQSSEAY